MKDFVVFAQGIFSMLQGVAYEVVGIPMISVVFGRNQLDGFFETDFVHVKV
jgi:hypothetical protein